ncbi:MAG: acetyltransferase [Nevskiaceae bacterium]|nr:MAG: acetyltransferase [Nevskiaceae bacterium]TBR71651.1 MAG: acetyltransferase [Nevskiaceae bacterium]
MTAETLGSLDDGARHALAERIRGLLMAAAANAWDDARISGLCGDGGWEIAYAAMRDADLSTALSPGNIGKKAE